MGEEVKRKIYAIEIQHLAEIINLLEGGILNARCHGHFGEFNIDTHRIDRLKEHEEFRSMVDEINAVIKPIKKKYAKQFRKKLAQYAADFADYDKEETTPAMRG